MSQCPNESMFLLAFLQRLHVRLQRSRILPFGIEIGLQLLHQDFQAVDFEF